MSAPAASPRAISVQADWNGAPATIDLDSAHSDAETLDHIWRELKHCYATLPPPFTKDGPSYRLTYRDSEGDEVELDSCEDVREARLYARTRSPPILELFIRPPTKMARSTILDAAPAGEEEDARWEELSASVAGGASTTPKMRADSQEPQSAVRSQSQESIVEVDAAAPVVGESPAPLVEEPDANKAQPLTIEEYNHAPRDEAAEPEAEAAPALPESAPSSSSAVASEEKPAVAQPVASPAVQQPAASPSSWSLFGIFGRGAAPTSASSSAPATNAPLTESIAETPLSQADSLHSSSFSAELSSSQLKQQQLSAENDFEEMDDDKEIAAAMDAAAAGMRGNALWDSSEVTQDVLSRVFTSMLARTEERLGLDAAPVVPIAGSFVRQPHQALLAQLRGIDVRAFDGLVRQFVDICAEHVERVAAEAEAAEKAKVAELVRELAEKAEREEQERLRAEAELARLAEEQAAREEELRREAVCREEEARQMAAAAEAERQAAERAAAEAAEAARLEAERAAAEADRQAKLAAVREKEESLRAKREALREAEQRELEVMAKKMVELKAQQEAAEREAEEAEREQRKLEAQAPVPVQKVEEEKEQPAAQPVLQPQAMPAVIPVPVVDRAASPSPLLVPSVPVPVASPLSPVQLSAAEKFNGALQELRAMGFLDDAMNTFVLQKTNLDITQAIDWLMADAASGGELKQSVAQSLLR